MNVNVEQYQDLLNKKMTDLKLNLQKLDLNNKSGSVVDAVEIIKEKNSRYYSKHNKKIISLYEIVLDLQKEITKA